MWSQQRTLFFIQDLHRNPCLWNLKSEDYKNRIKKNEALEALGVKYKVNAVIANNKIRALKNQFYREYRKIKVAEKQGLVPRRITWFGYKHLLFLLLGSLSTTNIKTETKVSMFFCDFLLVFIYYIDIII